MVTILNHVLFENTRCVRACVITDAYKTAHIHRLTSDEERGLTHHEGSSIAGVHCCGFSRCVIRGVSKNLSTETISGFHDVLIDWLIDWLIDYSYQVLSVTPRHPKQLAFLRQILDNDAVGTDTQHRHVNIVITQGAIWYRWLLCAGIIHLLCFANVSFSSTSGTTRIAWTCPLTSWYPRTWWPC